MSPDCLCGGGFTVVDNTGPGCGVPGSVENTRSRGLLGFAKNTGSTWCKTAQNVPGHRPPLLAL